MEVLKKSSKHKYLHLNIANLNKDIISNLNQSNMFLNQSNMLHNQLLDQQVHQFKHTEVHHSQLAAFHQDGPWINGNTTVSSTLIECRIEEFLTCGTF